MHSGPEFHAMFRLSWVRILGLEQHAVSRQSANRINTMADVRLSIIGLIGYQFCQCAFKIAEDISVIKCIFSARRVSILGSGRACGVSAIGNA